MNRMDRRQAKLFEDSEDKPRGEKDDKNEGQAGECIFCGIAKGGEQSRQIVLEDEFSLCFLDKRPVFLGHCLLIPRAHYETLYELPKDLINPIFSNLKLLSKAVERGLKAQGTFIAINNKVSQSVHHLHIHIVPRKFGDGLRGFFWPRQKYQSESQIAEIADSIRNAIPIVRTEIEI
jgi:histidine triad (HIT) family protein